MDNQIKIYLFRRNQQALFPIQKHKGDAGHDLMCVESVVIAPKKTILIDTGWDIKVAEGCWGSIKPRSSTLSKIGLIVLEGVIDSGYTGELSIVAYNPGNVIITLSYGDRVAQLLIIKRNEVEFCEVDQLPITSRGRKGFGSTGRGH